MKARVLFGVFGFAFVLLALYVFPPIVLELVVTALCVFATYEVLGSTKLVRNHLELLLAMAVSLGLAVGHFSILPLRLESVMQGLVLVLLFGSFAIELKYHDVMKAVSYTHLYSLGVLGLTIQYPFVDGMTGMGLVKWGLTFSMLRKGIFLVSVFVLPPIFGATAVMFSEPLSDVVSAVFRCV